MFSRIRTFTTKNTVFRGMLSYATVWPFACLAEQTLVEKRTFKTYDWMKCVRFSIFGGLFMAPTLCAWFRLAEVILPKRSLKSTLTKIMIESTIYDPITISCFLYSMALMEGKTTKEAKNRVSQKFFETYKVGLFYWPPIQVVNFTFVPSRYQVLYVSFFSMLWISFLSYEVHRRLPSKIL